MSDQPERPTTLKRAPKSPPRPAPDSGVDPIDATPPAAASPTTPVENVPPASPASGSRRQATVPLSTRISTEVDRILYAAVDDNNLTVRAAVEQAILHRWGNSTP